MSDVNIATWHHLFAFRKKSVAENIKLTVLRLAPPCCQFTFRLENCYHIAIMALKVTPPLSNEQKDQYADFLRQRSREHPYTSTLDNFGGDLSTTTLSLIQRPKGDCPWEVSEDGGQLYLIDTPREMSQIFIKWLLYIIYHVMRPLRRNVTGMVQGRIENRPDCTCVLTCKRNVVQIQVSPGTGKCTSFQWEPAQADAQFRLLFIRNMKAVFDKSGLKGWNILESDDGKCHIDPVKKIMYLSEEQLLKYSKLFGVQGIVRMVKTRICQVSQEQQKQQELQQRSPYHLSLPQSPSMTSFGTYSGASNAAPRSMNRYHPYAFSGAGNSVNRSRNLSMGAINNPSAASSATGFSGMVG